MQGSPSWVTVPNVYGSVWQLDNFAGTGPFDVRIAPSSGPAQIAQCGPRHLIK